MKVILRAYLIDHIHSVLLRGRTELVVMANMDEDQFLDAILDALESVSGETWERWKRIIDGDEK